MRILNVQSNRKKRKNVSSGEIKVLSTLKDFLNVVLIWTLLTSTAPFTFFVAIPWHPYKITIATGLVIAFSLLIIRGKIVLPDRIIIGILIAQAFLIVFPFSFFHSQFHQVGYVSLSIQYIAILLLYLYVYNYYSIHKMAKSFLYVMVIMAIMGGIAFFLGLIGRAEIYSIHQNPDGRTAYNFFWTYSNAISPVAQGIVIRVAGFFDEPGTFAYFLTFALLLNKIYDFSKKIEYILIIGGLFTLSLAFYITIIVYFILFYGNFKQLKYLILGAILIISLGFYINTSRYDSPINSQLYDLTLRRFEIDTTSSEKVVEGDNRSELYVLAWEAFQDSPVIGQGILCREDTNCKYYNQFMGANLFSPLAAHGIIGFTILFLPFFYWIFLIFTAANSAKKKLLISCWLIVAMNFLQRPNVTGFFTYFTIIFFIESTKYVLKNVKKNQSSLNYNHLEKLN